MNINIYNEDNELINSYTNLNNNKNNNVTVSNIIKIKDNYYLIEMSKARSTVNLRFATDFFIFEVINIKFHGHEHYFISSAKQSSVF